MSMIPKGNTVDSPVTDSSASATRPVADRELDVTGMNCPLPILKTKAEFARMGRGEILCVKHVREEYVRELEMFSQQSGNRLLFSEAGDGFCLSWVEKV